MSAHNLRFYVLPGLPGVPEKGVGSKNAKIIEIIDLCKKNLIEKHHAYLFLNFWNFDALIRGSNRSPKTYKSMRKT